MAVPDISEDDHLYDCGALQVAAALEVDAMATRKKKTPGGDAKKAAAKKKTTKAASKSRRPKDADDDTSPDRWARYDDGVIISMCQLMIDGEPMEDISAHIWDTFHTYIDRVQVTRALGEAGRRRMFHLLPPEHATLSQRMVDCFGSAAPGAAGKGSKRKTIAVVKSMDQPSLAHIAAVAAQTTLSLIRQKFKEKNPGLATKRRVSKDHKPNRVHVGIGAGATTRMIARYLADEMRAEADPPWVNLHALSSGFLVDDPISAPNAYFSFFDGIPGMKYTGLFSKPYVTTREWKKACEGEVGVCEAVKQKDKLDIVVTSLASAQDAHGELNRWMDTYETYAKKSGEMMKKAGRVGDVMYRPFSDTAPIVVPNETRAATLFELTDLVKFAARKGKAVVLVAGPCGHPDCRRSRDDALYPLLTQRPKLDVWTHLVTDEGTASNTLARWDASHG